MPLPESTSRAPASRAQPTRPVRIAVLIPALDEEEALPLVLAAIPRDQVDVVVVVDNGSRDRTPEVALEGGARLVREPRRGYGRACLAGLELLLGDRPADGDAPGDRCVGDDRRAESGARGGASDTRGGHAPLLPLDADDIVVFLDGDHSDDLADLPALLGPLRARSADFVVGSRNLGLADRGALLPQARFGNAFACWLMRVLFGVRHTDLGPFRAIRVGALEHLKMADRDFGWTIEMQLKAHAAGLRVVEVPVHYRARVGRSKVTGTLRGTIGAGVKILGWIAVWRCATWLSRRRTPTYLLPARSGR